MAKAVFIVPREEHPTLYYFAPLAILSLAGRLNKLGYQTPIIDAKFEEDDFTRRVAEETQEAELLWASGKIGRQLVDLIEGMKTAKEANPQILTLFGGWHASLEPASTIASPYIDIVVRGQGEKALEEIAAALENGGNFSRIEGLTYKKDSQIITNPDRSWDRDFDQNLPLDYELIDLERYITADGGKGLEMVTDASRSLNYTSSRGCHGRCSFCHITALYQRGWYGASVDRVLDDLALLKEKYRIDGIDFHDSNFFTNRPRAGKIMQGMIDRKLGLKWRASIRADQVLAFDRQMLDLMYDSGAVEMAIGGETASQRIMDLVKKDISPNDILRCSKILADRGIHPVYSMMVGFPDEVNWQDTKGSIAFMARLRDIVPDSPIEYFYYTPFPGTPLFDYAVTNGGLVRPETLDGWTIFSPYDPNMPWVDDKLAWILKIAKTFYFRFAVPDEDMRRKLADHRFRLPLRLLSRISQIRVRRGWYGLAFEYRLARFIKDVVIGRWGLLKGLRKVL